MKIKRLSILIIVIVIGLMLIAQMLSFINFRIWGNKQANILFENIVMDISDRITAEISAVKSVAFNISVDETVQDNIFKFNIRERARNLKNFENVLEKYSLNSKSIRYVGVVVEEEIICFSILNGQQGNGLYSLTERVLSDYKKQKNKDAFIGNYIYGDRSYFVCVSDIFSLDVINGREKQKAQVVIFFDPAALLSINRNIDETKVQIAITDKEDIVLASNGVLKTGEKCTFNKNSIIITKTAEFDETSCKVHVAVPVNEVLDVMQPSYVLLILMLVFTIAVFAFLMITLMKAILKPILEIEKGASIITNGNYEYRFNQQGENEISNIAVAINGILDAVEKSNDEKLSVSEKLFEVTLLQKQAEISHMQNQISPHFLYNSMEQISSIAKQNNLPEIVAITNIMADTFRYNTDGTELTTVGEDIDYAFNYFNIINLRRTNPISVIYSVSDEVLVCKCLKMIFQPVLENIIKHAFKNNKDGTVEITGYCTEEYVIIDVKDNGFGIEEERLSKIKKMLDENESIEKADGGIGVLNVHRRLRIFSDDESCGISIESKLNEGTVVRIKFKKSN